MVRWRILPRAEIENGDSAGCVDVRRTVHSVVPCILEQWDEHRGAWLPVLPEYVK